jgi:hypothetical protein
MIWTAEQPSLPKVSEPPIAHGQPTLQLQHA